MLRSERSSLFRFLAIYLTSTFVLFSFASWIFYASAKHHLLDQQRESLTYESERIKSGLRFLHRSSNEKLLYPQSHLVRSAIYDLDKTFIFGTFVKPPALDAYHDSKNLYLMTKIEPYYLGAAYLLVEKEIDVHPIEILERNIFLFLVGAGVFFSFLGYFLGKLFVAPMRASIEQMNYFIQDTTHELNTPISTILTNIEMIEALGKNRENAQELKRIEIASKTLSRIYDDLTYLNLNHDYHRDIVTLDMSVLLQERVEYFAAMMEAKALKVQVDIKKGVLLDMDKNDAMRLVDNLISNAIKYNRQRGSLFVTLHDDCFCVKDTGMGIERKELGNILQRFKRANKSEGGFGIGLDIVNQVVENYGFSLDIYSVLKKETEVVVRWQK